ncbi:peptidase M14 [Rhizobium sp. FKY42]|uniref:peptidase M14 n=1 Tax=Rhizobium sp. FKY42 TaxID=2562310 RepID=UPI0010BFCAEB|nr:peptidase M14 [Rhizobium sp. FKY42]
MVRLFQKTYDRMFDRVMNLLRDGDLAEVWSFDDRQTRLQMEVEAKSRGIELRARSAYKPLVNAFLEEIDLSDVTAVSVSYPVSSFADAKRFRLEAYPLAALVGSRSLELRPKAVGEDLCYDVELSVGNDVHTRAIYAPNRVYRDLTGQQVLAPTGWLRVPARGLDQRIETDFEEIYKDAMAVIAAHAWRSEGPFFEELNFSVQLPQMDEPLPSLDETMSLREALHEDLYFSALEYFTLKSGKMLGDRNVRPGQIVPEIIFATGCPELSIELRPYDRRARIGEAQPLDEAQQALGEAQIVTELNSLPGETLTCETVVGRLVHARYLKGTDAPILISGGQHANETSGIVGALRAARILSTSSAAHFTVIPCENPDGHALQGRLSAGNPSHMSHAARYTALGDDLEYRNGSDDALIFEKRLRIQAQGQTGARLHINLHGYPAHEWTRPLTGYVPRGFPAWMIPKGFFLILRHHEKAMVEAMALLDRVTRRLASQKELMDMNGRQRALFEMHAGPNGFTLVNGFPCMITVSDQGLFPVTLITEYPDETLYGTPFIAAHTVQMETVLAAYQSWQEIRRSAST